MMNRYILILLTLLYMGCANIVPPSGGEKDTNPPNLLASTSKFNIDQTTLSLEFNERIEENNFKKYFYTSPPINNFKYQIKGKLLEITIHEEISDDTKYFICLDNCIKDITEGNILSSLSFEINNYDSSISKFFSLDVLLENAYTRAPEQNQWVLIYDKEIDDSLIFKNSPKYISRTNDKGISSFNNLTEKTYKVASISGSNYYYDLGDVISFSNVLVSPFKDSSLNLLTFDPNYNPDSTITQIDTLTVESGPLKVSTNITGSYIVQILKSNRIILEKKITNSSVFQLNKLTSGDYNLKIILDENGNGLWDTGDFKKRRQPEKVFVYPEKIIIRPNWDLELIWNITQ